MFDSVNQVGTSLQGNIIQGFTLLGLNPTLSLWIVILITAASLWFLSYVFFFIAKRYLLDRIERFADKRKSSWWKSIAKYHVIRPLLHLVPAFIIYVSAPLFAISPASFAKQIVRICQEAATIYGIISIALAISAFLNVLEDHYRKLSLYYQKPIKGYVQVAKIFLFILVSILIIAELLDKSPTYLLTSIGALTAFILLIFKDAITSFVASIQIAADDLIRLGDWIESSQYGVNGEVIDMSLNNIKVQNFDKTIITVPTYALLSSGIKNWRGVTDTGARLIKRAISIDVNSIKFCDITLLERLHKQHLLTGEQTQNLSNKNVTNIFPTNLKIFRNYLQNYLIQHAKVSKDMPLVVRHLAASSTGLPIEVNFFTVTSDWPSYEEIQAEIFEHIFAILPQFDLLPFQYPAENPLTMGSAKSSLA